MLVQFHLYDASRFGFLYLFIGKLVLTYAYTVFLTSRYNFAFVTDLKKLAITISATRITKALRIDVLEHTLRQEIAYFDNTNTGSVSVKVTTSANLVSHGIGEKLGVAISALATFVSAFIVALAVQWKLALITIAIIPLLVIVTGVTV
jgi:ATP-binding cassette subfamily B (MDR/TAP) protein 1